MSMTLYCIPDIQTEAVTAYCFDCGHINVGAIWLDDTVLCFPCRFDDCPHLDRQETLEGYVLDGEPVAIRKLKEIPSC
jgi:hypothetical protein